ncbi:hypothetical protein J3A83DRAFT_4250288 [Scleroderma citrinum]
MTDDFFNSVPFSGQGSTNQGESVDSFAQAIDARFGSADLLTARLLPDDIRKDDHNQQIPQHQCIHLKSSLPLPPPPFTLMPPPHKNQPHDLSPRSEPHSDQPFSSITPATLFPYLSDTSTLILDIRPHAAHASARINRALSLSVPSTLLKRPLFSLSKLAQMLPSSFARSRFSTWPGASRIVVYDADSSHLPHNSNIAGLLRKFRAEGFTGELGWVRGGFQAVWRESRELTTTEQPSPEDEDADPGNATSALRTKHLPKAAFSATSTFNGVALGASEAPHVSQTMTRAANPFFDAIRQNVELSQGITERIPLRLPRRVRRRLNDLPFPWLCEITRRSAIRNPSPSSRMPGSESESSDEPHTSDPDEHDPEVEEGTEALAMQFYRIELAEQRRLQTIMEHHSRESEVTASGKAYIQKGGKTDIAVDDRDVGGVMECVPMTKVTPHTPHSSFPFSITAGVEKGTKNRYNHIWPFEHARVRLHDGRHQGSHLGSKGQSSDRGSGHARDGIRRQSTSGWDGFAVAVDSIDATRERVPPLSQPTPQVDSVDTDSRMSEFFTSPTTLPSQTPMDISPMGTQLPFLISLEDTLSEPTVMGITLPSSGPPHPHDVGLSMNLLPKIRLPLPSTVGAAFLGDNIERETNADLQQGNTILPGVPRVSSPLDDYVNASYVQPLGTRKKYIATQGPLPATFVDFWTLVWEQNVHVIVMLTREVENSMVKCGTYWADTSYGPFRLELLSTSPPLTPAMTNSTDMNKEGFFFALREPRARSRGVKSAPTTITRRFALSHTSYPGVPPRCIVHLQYLDWPDMNVPEDPRGVLGLIKRVERAVAESSPGSSPSGSGILSPGSSISPGSTSPGVGYENKELVCNKRSGGWRHPELDRKTGVATFALGKPPPVLLHCSAGVGRTGGFIAIDAVLDGIRRELNENRKRKVFLHSVMAVRDEASCNRNGDANTELAAGGMERVIVDSPAGDGDVDVGDSMDVDKPSSSDGQIQSHVYTATASLHVTAGDRKKSRKYQRSNPMAEKGSSSAESLVLHVPIAENSSGTNNLGTTYVQLNDAKAAGWQTSSTRAWAERVSDQTNALGTVQPPEALTTAMSTPALHPSSRARSPAGASSSSGLSMLNSADDLVGGSAGGSASGGGSNTKVPRKSESASASASGSSSGRADPPPSSSTSASNAPSSISISASDSGNSTGTGFSSGLESTNFMSLMRSRLMDSSATSLSDLSAGPFPPDKPVQGPPSIRQPSILNGSSINASVDMNVDRPPRAISVPLNNGDQASLNGTISQRTIYHSRAQRKPSLGSSPAASFSAPSLTSGASARGVPYTGSTESSSRSSSNHSLDELINSGKEREIGASNQVAGDEAVGTVFAGETEESLGTSKVAALDNDKRASVTSGAAMDHIPISCDTKAELVGGPIPRMRTPTVGSHRNSGDSVELDFDNPIIDYKLPRPLHTEVSPPLLSSYRNPIWTVVQDMREQRMSLCQSLRQYVFVHAAVIEGALQIVDEEWELWEDLSSSDESLQFHFSTSPCDEEKVYEGDDKRKVWVRGVSNSAIMFLKDDT